MKVTFDIAGADQAEDLTELMREYAVGEGARFDEPKTRRALEEIFSCAEFNRVWIAREGADAIGYLILTLGHSVEYGGRDAFIDEVYLRPSHRGRGIGERAMRVAEEEAMRMRVRALHLEVDRGNQAALGLYRKLGYEPHERVLMTKALGGGRP